jgi:hypothetical protein
MEKRVIVKFSVLRNGRNEPHIVAVLLNLQDFVVNVSISTVHKFMYSRRFFSFQVRLYSTIWKCYSISTI